MDYNGGRNRNRNRNVNRNRNRDDDDSGSNTGLILTIICLVILVICVICYFVFIYGKSASTTASTTASAPASTSASAPASAPASTSISTDTTANKELADFQVKWNNAGCTTTLTLSDDFSYWKANPTKVDADMKAWATINDISHNKKCYGKTFIPPASCTDTKYIIRTYDNAGNILTYCYPAFNYLYYVDAVDGKSTAGINNFNYSAYDVSGVEFKDNKDTVFSGVDDRDAYNSYGTSGINNAGAVKAMIAPEGYTKQDKYLFRYQYGPDHIFAVFKKI